MKLVLMTFVTVASVFAFAAAAPAAAEKLTCKKSQDASNQGVELKISGPNALILNKGKTVAKLRLSGKKQTGEISIATYSENTLNGYSAKVQTGGVAPGSTATILRSGFAGPQPIAELNDCR